MKKVILLMFTVILLFIGGNLTAEAQTKGWIYSKNSWHYYQDNGALTKGWKLINSKWYYFDSNGNMKTGWVKTGGKWYYFNKSGAMQTGWLSDGGHWYYLDKSGAMLTGWLFYNGQWYYLDQSGAMVTDWKQINNKWYYFYSSGAMAANTIVNDHALGANGAWISNGDTIPPNLNSVAHKIYPICVQYGYSKVSNLAGTGGACYSPNVSYPVLQAGGGFLKSDKGTGNLAVDVVMAIGSPDSRAELLSLVQSAVNNPHSTYVSESLQTIIQVDNGGSIMIEYPFGTRTSTDGLNDTAKKMYLYCQSRKFTMVYNFGNGGICYSPDDLNTPMIIAADGVVKSKYPYDAVEIASELGSPDTKDELYYYAFALYDYPDSIFTTTNGKTIKYADGLYWIEY